MRLLLRGLAVCAASLALASCATGNDGDADVPTALSPADHDIAAVLYAGTPRVPAGFAADPAPPSFTQVTTYHVKSSQLAAPAATVHEMCTDDAGVALAWSDEVAAQAAPYLDLVATQTTERYFELDRVPRGEPDRYVRMRVLRCTYLDRTGVELSLADGYAGTLNARPIDAAALRALAEYLWQFTVYNNGGHAVLASEPRGAGLEHALTIASLERAVIGTCDRVTLREWTHEAAPATGVLTHGIAVVREFGVREEAGVLVGC
jgi:hypothetical protein